MLRLPTRPVTEAARRNLQAFRTTAAALELADDPRTWDVVGWSWAPGPPLRVSLRNEHGEVLEFEMDDAGCWRIHPDRNDPKEPAPLPS